MILKGKKSDWVMAVGIIAVISMMYGSVAIGQRKILKEQSLIYELVTLRYAVTVFKITNDRYPADLVELVEDGFMGTGAAKKRYVPSNMLDGLAILDPFGNPYRYDVESGWISSSTEGYKFW